MKKLTHAELAAAQARGDWDLLWAQAMPLVKMVVGRMGRSGSVRSEDADDDLLQQGMLIAGDAMRAWRPLECAFSTAICNAVRWKTFEFLGLKHNGGIGSYKQQPAVLSTEDSSNGCSRGPAIEDMGEAPGEQDVDGSFNSALTYAGVLRSGDQYDGLGFVPEGFDDPANEVERLQQQEQIEAAVDTLTLEEQEMVRCLYGWGREQETRDQYARRTGSSERTVSRRIGDIHIKLARRLRGLQSHRAHTGDKRANNLASA